MKGYGWFLVDPPPLQMATGPELDIKVKKDGRIYELTIENSASGIKNVTILSEKEVRGLRNQIVEELEK